jgi:hypothetical protein
MGGALRFLIIATLLILTPAFSLSQTDFWQPSDGPYGGIMRDIKANSQGHLVAASNCRLFKSMNSGLNWTMLDLGSMSLEGVGDFYVDSSGVSSSGIDTGLFARSITEKRGHLEGNSRLSTGSERSRRLQSEFCMPGHGAKGSSAQAISVKRGSVALQRLSQVSPSISTSRPISFSQGRSEVSTGRTMGG